MIEVKGLTKYYGPIAAIKDVSFAVAKGEIMGFLGPNGAGKSTTMRILTGFSPASRGTVTVDGFDIGEHPIEVKRRIGYLPETVPLYPEMVTAAFLRYVAAVKGIPRSQRRAEVGRVIERCGLESVALRLVHNLSKGFRQRVGLAQALLGNPPVLVLDEPTVGLDPRQIIEIREMIRGLAAEHTVLLSTHILPEVTMICERVIILHRGRIVAEDTMANLARDRQAAMVTVETDGPRESVLRTLRALPEVAEVAEEGAGRYRVTGAPGMALGGPVSEALVRGGLGLRCLEAHKRTLEDIFMATIASEPEDVPVAGAAAGGGR